MQNVQEILLLSEEAKDHTTHDPHSLFISTTKHTILLWRPSFPHLHTHTYFLTLTTFTHTLTTALSAPLLSPTYSLVHTIPHSHHPGTTTATTTTTPTSSNQDSHPHYPPLHTTPPFPPCMHPSVPPTSTSPHYYYRTLSPFTSSFTYSKLYSLFPLLPLTPACKSTIISNIYMSPHLLLLFQGIKCLIPRSNHFHITSTFLLTHLTLFISNLHLPSLFWLASILWVLSIMSFPFNLILPY